MSAIATFTLLPTSFLDGLREVSVPKALSGGNEDEFHPYLEEHGRELGDYGWSGYVLGTLLPYLQQKKNINLMRSDFDELASFITNARQCSCFIMTNAHRENYLDLLSPASYVKSELRAYFEDFNATRFEEAGKAMIDGIALIQANLSQVNSESILLLYIG